MALEIFLFGPMRVLVQGKPMPRFRTRSVEWLLALLALRPGRPVNRSWLAGTLWPTSEERQALENLRHDLVVLRKALGAERIRAPSRDGLVLDLTDASCDASDFDAAIEKGDDGSLRRALDLYKGPLLEGCQTEWIFADRESRAEQCLNACETLARRAAEQGEHDMAVQLLRRAEGMDSLRDSVARHLMESLVAIGEPGLATQAYRNLRRRLLEELNTSPDGATTRLFQQIRSGVRAPSRVPERRPTGSLRRPPQPLSSLIGRTNELAEVRELLGLNRLVTLVGAGGIGKTRIALQVASAIEREFVGDVAWVELANLTEGGQILPAIATALGISEEPQADGDAMIQRILSRVAEGHFLLAVDNCEHLMDEAAAVVETLLTSTSELRVLATSRQRFGIPGEVAWRVPSLAVPDPDEPSMEFSAVQLFMDRARGARQGFKVSSDDDVAAVCTICKKLDGIPLALELAAARIGSLTPTQIAARLDDRFALLTSGARTAVPRQKTLRALIEWSYDLLDDDERNLLRHLAVFSGGWTLEAAEAVGGEVLDTLASLADKSLVVAEESADGIRYRMLETIREYTAERLRESGEEDRTRDDHLSYYLEFAKGAAPGLRHASVEALASVGAENGNLHAALSWARSKSPPDSYGRLVADLWPYWQRHGSLFEGSAHVQAALDSCPETERSELLKGAYALARVLHDEHSDLVARLNPSLGAPALWRENYLDTVAALERTLAIQRKLGQKADMIVTMRCLGSLAEDAGDRDGSLVIRKEALAIARELGSRVFQALTLHEFGCVLYRLGDFEGSSKVLSEALDLFMQPGGEFGIGFTCNNLGMARLRVGDRKRSAELHRQALAYFLPMSFWNDILWSLAGLSRAGLTDADALQAAQLLGAASEVRKTQAINVGLYDEAVAAVRALLGEATFNREFEFGASLQWPPADVR